MRVHESGISEHGMRHMDMDQLSFHLEVSRPQAVTGTPKAGSPARGSDILVAGGHGPPDKSLAGRSG